jgi:large subunit ribosomal protein L16
MLMPARTKFRKVRKGRIHGGTATALNQIAYGRYGLVSLGSERISARQIEASRQAMTRYVKRGGQVWIRIFPHIPVTRKHRTLKWAAAKVTQNFL